MGLYKVLEFQALSGQNSRPVALKVSFAGLVGPFGVSWDHLGPFGAILSKNNGNRSCAALLFGHIKSINIVFNLVWSVNLYVD